MARSTLWPSVSTATGVGSGSAELKNLSELKDNIQRLANLSKVNAGDIANQLVDIGTRAPDDIRLNLGSMKAPIEAMNMCMANVCQSASLNPSDVASSGFADG